MSEFIGREANDRGAARLPFTEILGTFRLSYANSQERIREAIERLDGAGLL